MNDINAIWEIYRSSWHNDNAEKRSNDLRHITTEDFQYRDPNVELSGFDQLSDYMSEFQKEFVGASFTISGFQLHHDTSMAHWNMVNAENEVVGIGTSFATYEKGKLKQVTGFFKQD